MDWVGTFTEHSRIALTIDTELAGHMATPDAVVRQLDALAGARVPATFFLEGRWLGANRALARRLGDAGHLIGNHTYHHAPLSMMTDEGIRHTVRRAEHLIIKLVGVDPRPWFRCPYGDGQDDARVRAVLAELGYRSFGWDAEAQDWRDGLGVDDMLAHIVPQAVAAGDGAVLLLHSWPDVTAAALPELIAVLRDAGAHFVRLDELAGVGPLPSEALARFIPPDLLTLPRPEESEPLPA
jgi:peptidoglycan/xylan/chitin deacetylase (PgdA/CDA1 family)